MNPKTIISTLFLFIGISLNAQQNAVEYSYDNAGNRILRKIIVLPPAPPPGQSAKYSAQSASIDTVGGILFKIYPNPTEGLVIIQSDENFRALENKTITVYDVNGKILLKKEYNSSEEHIDLSNQEPGSYFVKITASNGYNAEWKIIRK
jgi:hypothetical protein